MSATYICGPSGFSFRDQNTGRIYVWGGPEEGSPPTRNNILTLRSRTLPHWSEFTPHRRACGHMPSSCRRTSPHRGSPTLKGGVSLKASRWKVSPPTRRRLRNCPHLSSSGFRRDEGESLPNRAGLTRAGEEAFPAIGGGEIMERAIRVRAVRSALHGSGNAVFPSSRKA